MHQMTAERQIMAAITRADIAATNIIYAVRVAIVVIVFAAIVGAAIVIVRRHNGNKF